MYHTTTYLEPPQCRSAVSSGLGLSRQVLKQLEHLDDTIFAAINGDAEALDRAAFTWEEAVAGLGWAAVEESRQQYLRRANAQWKRLRDQPGHPPEEAFAALEIISLLSYEA